MVPRNFTAEDDETVCTNKETQRQHARTLKTDGLALYRGSNSVLCCDREIETTNQDFLEVTDCVPYRNMVYDVAIARNTVGQLRPVTCDVPGFGLPVAQSQEEFEVTGRYQCCTNGSADIALPPFVHDKAFRISVYPQIFFWTVASVVSAIVAIALLVPLVVQLANGRYQKARESSRSSRKRSLSLRSGTGESQYSIYNLYLVYLAVVDLLFSLARLTVFGGMANQEYNPSYYAAAVVPTNPRLTNLNPLILCAYVLANTWINAIICYQVLVLLRSLQSTRRVQPPTLKKVNLQAGSICLFSVLAGYGLYLLLTAVRRAQFAGDFQQAKRFLRMYALGQALGFGLPFLFVVVVTLLIWWKGYLPSLNGRRSVTSLEKAMRELAVYFFRIVAIFVVVWLPSLCLSAYAMSSGKGWVYVLTGILTSIQPILTFCVVLTKSDARAYIVDLVTLSFLFEREEDEDNFITTKTSRVRSSNNYSRSGSDIASALDGNNTDINGDEEEVVCANEHEDGDNGRDFDPECASRENK